MKLLFIFGLVVMAAVYFIRKRGRRVGTAKNFPGALSELMEADEYCVQAQKVEVSGDIKETLTLLSMAVRHMMQGARYAVDGYIKEDDEEWFPPSSEDWPFAHLVEHVRTFVRGLGVNDGLVAEIMLMEDAASSGRAVDRRRLITLVHACRDENYRLGRQFLGHPSTWREQ